MQSSLACPVLVRGEPAAVLMFSSLKGAAFSQNHAVMAHRMARVVGTVLERTRLGDQLVRTRREMDRFFKLSLDLLCVANTEGYFRMVSHSFERVLGHDMRTLLDTPFLEFVHPEDRAATLSEMAKLEAGERTVAFENRYRCGDGSYRWLEWNAVPLPEEDAIYAVARDITGIKELNHKLCAVVRHAPIAMVLIDPTNRIVHTNRHLETLFGFDTEELIGSHVAKLIPERFQDEYGTFRSRLEAGGERMDIGVGGKLYGIRKDGSEVPVEIAVTSLDLGQPHLLVAVTDVTRRHRAMNRIRSIVEASADGILLADLEGRIRFHNVAARRIFGHSERVMSRRSLDSLLPERHRSLVAGALRSACAANDGSKPIHCEDMAGVDQTGREVPLQMAFRSVEIENERLAMITVQDLTEQQKIDKEFSVAREVQRALLPKEMPRVPGFEILADSRPAEATCGDFVNFTSMGDGGLVFAIGDVSGHGLGPAILTASVMSYLRAFARSETNLSEILRRTNELLFEETRPEDFATAFLGRLEPETGRFTYACAGHPPGFVFDREGRLLRMLGEAGFPIGALAVATEWTISETRLAPGETLVLITDGITEAESPNGRNQFEDEGVLAAIEGAKDASLKGWIEAIYDSVEKYTGSAVRRDDMTVMAVRAELKD